MQQGQDRNAYVFLFFTSSSCSYCDKMKNRTFTDRLVINTLKQYVCVEVNISTDKSGLMSRFLKAYQNHPFSKQWSGHVPVYFLINANQYECAGQGMGYLPPEQFIEWLRDIKKQGYK